MTQKTLIETLGGIVGKRHVLTEDVRTRRYRKGYRYGEGDVLAVVCPGTLVALWRVLQTCVAADVIVIMQAANTGLTGGSTPDGDDYDRPVVIINTLRLKSIYLLDHGRQALCFPGATLYKLEDMLRPLGREPHSVIGSSCIGASVMGGVCNNSGGALVKRGPAYTELALFARRSEDGTLELVNHLGIALGDTAEDILGRLDRGDFSDADIVPDNRVASDQHYADHVRNLDADTPARFNADPRRLHEASGCAGKLAVFAARLDTFESEGDKTTFYIGTNNVDDLTALRRALLEPGKPLPVSGEYMHRDAYDISARYGKDTFLAINAFGTGFLPYLFKAKGWVDALCERAEISGASDRALQRISEFLPHHLPPRMNNFRDRYEHHLILDMAGAENSKRTWLFLTEFFKGRMNGAFFKCSAVEAKKAHLHRFAAAGAGIRYQKLHEDKVGAMVALDIALRRNDDQWFESLPDEIRAAMDAKLYYGHFFCHVFHQDYLIKRGYDAEAVKAKMLALLDRRGAEYPAEHNVGHTYDAKPVLKDFYRQLDPCNSFNPGIGHTSKRRNWSE